MRKQVNKTLDGNNTLRYLLKHFELLNDAFDNCLFLERMLHNCTAYGAHMCILRSYICDGIFDCSDQSDEHDCDYVRHTNDTSRVCVDLYYHCRSEECIPRDQQCDGQADCDDGSDELDCPTQQREWGTVLDSRHIDKFISKVY